MKCKPVLNLSAILLPIFTPTFLPFPTFFALKTSFNYKLGLCLPCLLNIQPCTDSEDRLGYFRFISAHDCLPCVGHWCLRMKGHPHVHSSCLYRASCLYRVQCDKCYNWRRTWKSMYVPWEFIERVLHLFSKIISFVPFYFAKSF